MVPILISTTAQGRRDRKLTDKKGLSFYFCHVIFITMRVRRAYTKQGDLRFFRCPTLFDGIASLRNTENIRVTVMPVEYIQDQQI